MEIIFGKEFDIDGWMNLIYSMKENILGLKTNEILEEY